MHFGAIVIGVLEIAAAVRLREVFYERMVLELAGLVAIALLIPRPDTGALAVPYAIGAYAILFGVLVVLFAFRIRSFVSKVTSASKGTASRLPWDCGRAAGAR